MVPPWRKYAYLIECEMVEGCVPGTKLPMHKGSAASGFLARHMVQDHHAAGIAYARVSNNNKQL